MFNKKNLFLFGFLALLSVGGVFAYWTQELQVRNEFMTAKYDTKVVEDFEPPTEWTPGQEVNKDVSIRNEGTIPVFIRVAIAQEWVRKENVYDKDGKPIAPLQGEKIPLVFEGKEGKAYGAVVTWGEDVVLLADGKKSGLELGLPVVNDIPGAKGKWLLLTDEIDEQGNLYFYYIGNLMPEKDTPKLVDAVTMNAEIEPEIKGERVWYDEENNKVAEEIRNTTYGYENARYTMTVNADTVQATAAGLEAVFGKDEKAKAVLDYLAKQETMK